MNELADRMGFATPRQLTMLFGCKLRTAQRLIKELPPKYQHKLPNGTICGYLPMIRIPRKRPGNPRFKDPDFQRRVRKMRKRY